MVEKREFQLFESEISPRLLLEASAGSGKTWMLTGLYIRLLLEKDVTVEEILVLTFTKLATKELKDRIQIRLRQSLQALKYQDGGDDPFLQKLVQRYADSEKAREALVRALQDFDRAVIVTIHGFCQQVLNEETLLTGSPFAFEVEEGSESLQQAMEDEWRIWLHTYGSSDHGRLLLNLLESQGKSLESIRYWMNPLLNHPAAKIRSLTEGDPETCIRELVTMWEEFRERWSAGKQDILDTIRNSGVHKGHVTNHLEARKEKMDRMVQNRLPDELNLKLLEQFTRKYLDAKTPDGKEVPDHAFFPFCGRFLELSSRAEEMSIQMLLRFANAVLKRREQQATEQDRLNYQDLLNHVERALVDSPQAEKLAARLLKRYPYALLDEFQDTDPHQYNIFREIYPQSEGPHAMVMVGDPKQAIYSFRGGDVFTYLHARSETPMEAQYTLPRNFRSRPSMIEAINRLFSPSHSIPFLDSSIPFRPAEPGVPERENMYWLNGEIPPPLTISHAGEVGEEELWDEVARQVKELLRLGERGEALIGPESDRRPVSGGDLAILVSTNRQAEEVRRTLFRAGIRSISKRRESVFSTRESEMLIRLFRALLNPLDQQAFRDLVTTGLLGSDLNRIHLLLEEDSFLRDWREELFALKEVWTKRGCYPMVRRLLFSTERLSMTAWWDSRERMLTNLQQLMELICEAEERHALGPGALLGWLLQKRREASDRDEEILHLESDENLVRVMTIHGSKGLEFPIVFCPTLWYVRSMFEKQSVELIHQDDPPFRPEIVVGDPNSDEMKSSALRARFEQIGEEIRKCYVALTRARYACHIFLHSNTSSHFSGFGALQRGPKRVIEDLEKGVRLDSKKGPSSSDLWASILKLPNSYPGLFQFAGLTKPDSVSNSKVPHEDADSSASMNGENCNLTVRSYAGPARLQPSLRRYNFSALSDRGRSREDGRDYDDHTSLSLRPDSDVSDESEEDVKHRSIFQFPRGTRAGTFIHKLFEHPDFDFRSHRNHRSVIREVSDRYGIGQEWEEVLEEMLEAVSKADYGSLNLNQVAPEQMVKEMEFYFPSTDPDPETLQRVIRTSDTHSSGIPESLSGLMNGFIDLVVRFKGKYYILDYKSNHLGSSGEDYSEDELNKAMLHSNYDLQYHIYLVALVKYLRSRDPAFSYDKSIGGIYYLFVRGMFPGSRDGIYHAKPPRERIQELEAIWSSK